MTGEWLEPGDLIIGQSKFAKSIGLTRQKLRSALATLEKCGNLTTDSTSRGTHISICNYKTYQEYEKQNNQPANQRLTNGQPQNKKERSKEVKKKRRYISGQPANLDEVVHHWKEAGLNGDPMAFWDFYESKGWMVGKNPMKRWRAAASGWSRRSKSGSGQLARKTTQTTRRENNAEVLKRFMERHSDGDARNSCEGNGDFDGNLATGKQRLISGDIFAGDY